MTDLELLQDFAQTKSEQAFTELVGRHLAWIHSCARRLVRDAQTAEDVAQAVCIALAQNAASLGSDRPLAPWLFKVTRYASLKALRSQATRERHERKVAAMTSETSSDAAGETDWLRVAPLLDDFVAKLAEKDRRAVLLRFYQQMSFSQVGTTLGISEEAAKKRTGRAVDKLRMMFARHGVKTASPALLATTLVSHTSHPASAALLTAASRAALGAMNESARTAPAIELAKGAMNMMHREKMKAAAVLTVILAMAVVTGVAVSQSVVPRKSAATQPAAVAATQSTTLAYSEIIERELVGNNSGLSTIDLDTGKMLPGANNGDYPPTMAGFRAWLKGRGTDAAGAVGDKMLLGFEMVAVPVGNDQWDIQPDELKRAVSRGRVEFPAQIKAKADGPTTWLFKTREGGTGVLQVKGLSPDGKKIQFRYKLLKDVAATMPAAAP